MKRKDRINAIMAEILRNAQSDQFTENRPVSWKEYNFDRERGVRFMANVTAAVRMFEPLPDEVSAGETGLMLRCTKFLESESNMLCYRSNTEYKPLNASKLAKKLNMSTSHIYRFIHRMCRLRVMAKEKNRLYLNPVYFFRGRYLSWHLYKLFEPELQTKLPAWVVGRFEGKTLA